jgi:hypothetical protein
MHVGVTRAGQGCHCALHLIWLPLARTQHEIAGMAGLTLICCALDVMQPAECEVGMRCPERCKAVPGALCQPHVTRAALHAYSHKQRI